MSRCLSQSLRPATCEALCLPQAPWSNAWPPEPKAPEPEAKNSVSLSPYDANSRVESYEHVPFCSRLPSLPAPSPPAKENSFSLQKASISGVFSVASTLAEYEHLASPLSSLIASHFSLLDWPTSQLPASVQDCEVTTLYLHFLASHSDLESEYWEHVVHTSSAASADAGAQTDCELEILTHLFSAEHLSVGPSWSMKS